MWSVFIFDVLKNFIPRKEDSKKCDPPLASVLPVIQNFGDGYMYKLLNYDLWQGRANGWIGL